MLIDFLIDKFTEKNYPQVLHKKCLNFNKMPQPCKACKDICPKEAVALEYNKIIFDEDLCSSCGICKSICPTQAISMNGLGEENILRTINDKSNIVFSCSEKGGVGTLKLKCLNAFNPELLAAIFMMYEDRKFYFNISRCKKCDFNKNDLLLQSLEKAEDFVKSFGFNPKYEVMISEDNLTNLPQPAISRRDLFSLFKKESSNIAVQAVDTIVSDKNNFLSIRSVLLNAIKKIESLPKDVKLNNSALLRTWSINSNCNGCKKCEAVCSDRAWKIQLQDEKLSIYHNAGKCYGCGKCVSICDQHAIEEGDLMVADVNSYSLKKQINLTNCTSCNKIFVSNENKKICSICEKREALRKQIAAT